MAEHLLCRPREIAFDSVADFVEQFRAGLFESTAIWTDLPVPAGPLIPPSASVASSKTMENWAQAGRVLRMAL
jgi:hypothetical protein